MHLQMRHIALVLKSAIFQQLDLVRAKTPANKTKRRDDLPDYHRLKKIRFFLTKNKYIQYFQIWESIKHLAEYNPKKVPS